MSGEAGGILLIPLVLGIAPLVSMVLIGGAVVAGASVAASVASSYETRRRAERERIRQSEGERRAGEERIGAFRDRVLSDMKEQTRKNVEVSSRMAAELERSREETRRLLQGGDPEKYSQYVGQIQSSRADLNNRISAMQREFSRGYEAKIAESMEAVNRDLSRRCETCVGEIQQLRDSAEKKRETAKEWARAYLDEAKSLLDALRDDFQGAAFSGPGLATLRVQVSEANRYYGLEQYEACMGAAKNASVALIEEIYRADCRKQEWENCHKLALMLTAEIEAYLKNQEVITPEAKREMEKHAGRKLEDEIVGVRIGDYTDRTETGQCQFDYLLETATRQREELEAATPASVSTGTLKEMIAALNGKLYPAAMTSIYRGVLNMNNAFARQTLSEEIVKFFEDHNFTFSGYNYDGDRHDGALHIGLENESRDEEIVVTLSPELMRSGDVQTRVSIDQIRGDERNEERRAYYRQAVQEVVAQSTPGASLNLECKQGTRNRLSSNVDLKDKLKR
ncbi:MAG: hypothetical protein LBQ90_07930 [Synergistaceae bacterium]|jgi:hypothetical protein|nr:hypothetical protein [Synergistaceae bacterium]